MIKAELLGSHSHSTESGVIVHIFQREGKYIARGRYQGEAFGPQLGSNEIKAKSELVRILHEIELGTFQRPTVARKRPLKNHKIPNLDLRELTNRYLTEKRRSVGHRTTRDYKNRLVPAIEFAEQQQSLKNWRYAAEIDRNFALGFREFLINKQVTRNGRPAASSKLISARQSINCMEALRSLLAWACRIDVRLLPADFLNPMTKELIGHPPSKDPLRRSKLPQEKRITLIHSMDEWQFYTLVTLMILPLRFEDISGALISDVNFENRTLHLGHRLGGLDYNKGRVDVLMPLPEQLMPVLNHCRAGREEGPLFRNRSEWESDGEGKSSIESSDKLEDKFQAALQSAKPGQIQAPQDRKQLFRNLLKQMGGISSNYVGKQLRTIIGPEESTRPYDLRGSITQEMNQAGVRHLELRYLTEHSVNDIINVYSGLEPEVEMQKYYHAIEPLLEVVERRYQSLIA
ncbi:hypothetical protein [uncultured Rubinisphaera sp.]|uniref:hypothetical protein n=1 Tax=uncultured Rubinisphaera sp. TaxID=1678686 RepID=UPI0030DCC9C6